MTKGFADGRRVVAGWLVTVVLAFWARLEGSNWQRDEYRSGHQPVGQRYRETLASISPVVGRKLEDNWALKNAPPREIRTEVVKPVFTNVCCNTMTLRIIQRRRASTERTLSGKPEN